ncbi:MAG: hypothetical protein RBQ97_09075, partial [Acholeplasma sp.]|nr:hypothetical protein [Acholeplasma sp.]
PFPIWFYLAFVLFRRWQYKLAIERLYHYDSMNKGLLKSLGVVINFKGPPGGGKTTMMTDAGLNFDEIFKTEFNSTLREFQSYFPDFPFNEYEIYLRELIANGVIQNRHFLKIVVGRIFYEYEESHVFPFSYDLETQKTYVSIGNKLVFIQDALITYGEAFYYYSYDASLIAGNLSIRYDFELIDDKLHYPQWNYNAFTIDPCEAYEKTRFSKTIDFDSMRLHKKIRYDEEHPIMDVGVLLETEAAKQWGNQYDNSIYKKDDESANPLNDGFVDFLSTFRHGSLINYQPYMRYLQDYQRKGDMQSKIGELAETSINIFSDNKREIMTLPVFFYTPLVLEFLVNKWDEFYLNKYRVNRSDRTLLFYLINQLGSWANRYLITQRNKFVVLEKNIVTNLGSDDSNLTETKQRSYYFIIKKIYANRFASDALKRFFDSGDNVEGFKALKDYEGLYPSEQELLAQNSYFNNKRLRSNSVVEQQDDGPLF